MLSFLNLYYQNSNTSKISKKWTISYIYIILYTGDFMARSKQKPATELLLTKLEEEYLKEREKRIEIKEGISKLEGVPTDSEVAIYHQMFKELVPYARSLILKKTKGKIFLPPDIVDDTALESTVKFMSQYEKQDFKTRASFAGLLSFKVLESLYGPKIKAADRITSLNEHIENGRTRETELGELSESYNFTYLFRPYDNDIIDDPANYLFNKETDAINNMMTVIKDLYKCTTLHQFYIICIGIYQFIEKAKTLDKFKELFFTSEIEEIYEVSLLEIRNRLAGVL